jgi:predicted transcriptional regulator of viral defense system
MYFCIKGMSFYDPKRDVFAHIKDFVVVAMTTKKIGVRLLTYIIEPSTATTVHPSSIHLVRVCVCDFVREIWDIDNTPPSLNLKYSV